MDKGRNWREQVLTLHVYVEGGGTSDANRRLRKAFRLLIDEEQGKPCPNIRIIASGDRISAIRDFKRSITSNPAGDRSILLVDSDGAVPVHEDGWTYLANQPGCEKPVNASTDSAHLMIEIMESWIISDLESLRAYYSNGFRPNRIPSNPDVELIPKADVLSGLYDATRETSKGKYHKVRHGFDLIELLDPTVLKGRAARARQFFEYLATNC